MKINPYKGFFLAVEGLDGSGSDRAAKEVAKILSQEGYPIVFTKEPTEGQIGRFIKKLIKERGKVSPLVLEYLFSADRAILMEDRIIPSLKEGKIVVTDRCLWSSVAYRSLYFPIHWVLEINKEFILPDNTYFIDCSPLACVKKIKKSEDEVAIFETEKKLTEVREGYEWIGQKFNYCFDIIEPEEYSNVAEEIIKRVKRHQKFPRWRTCSTLRPELRVDDLRGGTPGVR